MKTPILSRRLFFLLLLPGSSPTFLSSLSSSSDACWSENCLLQRTTASVCAWSIEVITLACVCLVCVCLCVCVCVSTTEMDRGATVVFAVDLHPPMEARRPRRVCLCGRKLNGSRHKWVFTVNSPGCVCLPVWTHSETRAKLLWRAHLLVLVVSFFIWFVSSRCVLSGWKAARVHLFMESVSG